MFRISLITAALLAQSASALAQDALQDSAYADSVRQAVEAALVYPEEAQTQICLSNGSLLLINEEGAVGLFVELAADGRVRDVGVLESSGSDALDQAALTAIREVGAFAPPPGGAQTLRAPVFFGGAPQTRYTGAEYYWTCKAATPITRIGCR